MHIGLYILHTHLHQRENVFTEKFNSVHANIFAIFLEWEGKNPNSTCYMLILLSHKEQSSSCNRKS